MQRYPDIEVYLARAPIDCLNGWLGETLGAPPLQPAGKHKWRSTGQIADKPVPILLMERAADGFASLWLDSGDTPWPRDVDCAREAAKQLGCEVRCSLGGWQPGDSPDRFWRVLPNGEEAAIDWPDSGH